MAAISSLSLPGLTNTSPNPTHQNTRSPDNPSPYFSIKLGAGCSPAGDFLRQLSVSSVLLMGLGLSSVSGFCHPASARISPASPSSSAHLQKTLDAENVGNLENLESVEDEDMKLAFDRWKSKSYALTVALRIVALEGSVPPVWIREFLRSQGKRVRFRPEFRRSVGDIFNELSNPFTKGKINPKSAAAADLVSLGDSWLNFAIGKGLIEPLEGAEEQNWFQDLSDKWKMSSCKPIATPIASKEKLQLDDGAAKVDEKMYRSLVGSLIYLTNTRPDIVYPVSLISRFMHNPSKIHFAAAKRILRYLQGTRKFGIKYVKEMDDKLVGFTDSDWAGSLDDRKSTSGYIFCLGSKIISWASKKQKTVSLSSAEAEYIAASDAACEAVWLRRVLADIQQNQITPTTILCDNMSTIAMTKNPVFHARSKHIELRHHFIRDLVSEQEIQLEFVNTKMQLADGFTKAFTSEKLEQFRGHVNITN